MKTLRSTSRRTRAFTIAELLIVLGISGILFAAVMTAGTGSLRSLAAADDYSYESNSELLAMDYIARDLRSALTVTIPAGGQSLSVTLPQYYSAYDAQGNPNGNPITPTIVNGAPVYGDPTKPLTVAYAVSGANLIRTQTIQTTGAVSSLVVCANVNNFQLAFVPLSTTVTYTITFDPKYRSASSSQRTATTLAGTVSVRAIRFQ